LHSSDQTAVRNESIHDGTRSCLLWPVRQEDSSRSFDPPPGSVTCSSFFICNSFVYILLYIGCLMPMRTKNQLAGYDVTKPMIMPICIRNQ
jgi:hypothetical protein